jgi:hypothetical protein
MTSWTGKGARLGTIGACDAQRASNYNRLEPSRLTVLLCSFPLAGPQPWDNLRQRLVTSPKGLA